MIRVKDNLLQWLLLALLIIMLLVPVVGTAVGSQGYIDGPQGAWFQTQNSEASHAIACIPIGSSGSCGGGYLTARS